MYNIIMGNYFSSASNEKSGEENTINTDMLGDSEEIYTVERTQNELNKNKLNNKILNILDSETIKEGGNYNSNINIYNINKKIFNILNSIGDIRGGGNDNNVSNTESNSDNNSDSNSVDNNYDGVITGGGNGDERYLKYDILNILEGLEEEQKGGKYNDISESSISDLKNKISNIIKSQDGGNNKGGNDKGGNDKNGDNINDNYVIDILNSEIKNMKGGDCNCKKQTGGRYTSSSSSASSSSASSSSNSSSSKSSSSSSDSPLNNKKSSKKNKKSNKKSKKSKKMSHGGSSSNNSSDYKKIGNGISIFPFNSSSMEASSVSEKHFRLLRRHI